MTSWVAGNGTSHHPIEPPGESPANINRVAFKGKRHLNKRNMNMSNKDMIRIDDLFAPVSFGGGGGGVSWFKPSPKPAPIVVAASEKQDYCGSSTNGSEWIADSILGADISQACKTHDENYANGMDKEEADAKFHNDIVTQCVAGGQSEFVCNMAATTYSSAVGAFGQGAYDAAQE